MRSLLVAAAAFLAVQTLVTACKNDNPVAVGNVDADSVPTMTTRNVETLISDSGVVRYRITTPIWYVYDEAAEPRWNFPEGVNLEKYDMLFRREATVRADSATYFKAKELWRLDGNVNITNTQGVKFLTEQLFWDQRGHKLYSVSFIHIERPDRVLEGYGFDSNDQLTRYTIRRVSGIFPTSQFKPGEGRGDAPEPQEAGDDSAEAATGTDSTQTTQAITPAK